MKQRHLLSEKMEDAEMLAVEAGGLPPEWLRTPGAAQRRACARNHENSSGTHNWLEAEELAGKRLQRGTKRHGVTRAGAVRG